MSHKWVYLTDLAPQAVIKNLQTGEKRSINSTAVKRRAPSGLRRTVLTELSGGQYEETDEVLPLTVELAEEIEEHYSMPNSWIYDWPHLPTEMEVSDVDRQRVIDSIMAQMEGQPYEFQITGLQRRFLMYYSDGNHESQQRYERLIPQPGATPFNRSWDLKARYGMYYNSIMRDAKVPFPKKEQSLYGGLRPCLYVGPAWTLRFTIDGQDPLLERCRVYVMDDGTFIGSDWCQRHDFTSYGGGINLQMGIYNLASWITGPCLTYNASHNGIKLKNSTYKVEKVRDLAKKAPAVKVPEFEATFAKAQELIAKYAPPPVAAPAAPVVEVGPITPDVLTEADAAYQKALDELLIKRAGLTVATPERGVATKAEPVSSVVALGQLAVEVNGYRAGLTKSKGGHVNLVLGKDLGNGIWGTLALAHPFTDTTLPTPEALRAHVEHQLKEEDVSADDLECFTVDEDGARWYLGVWGEDMLAVGDDPLATNWYPYYFADMLDATPSVNPITATLLEQA